ncbi:hypothetical protein H2199_004947 [Coniosporium tulheliwenetii]|uniref:Uncharacterized protein n=1 Tax=Coniosporium tulheliwenetii TaxID=3383036 RepID=A0ACC2Z4G5_9PEZI|nr:hypothetical protein H2199_004947 [Cladosporium sp. JES 115]
MARLNEAPAAGAETIDALKRRFIRQNRDLAKTNSSQSIRIRSLEAEISRLLSQNLSLREEIIDLQAQLSSQQTHPADATAFTTIRDALSTKIRELTGLVTELGTQTPSERAWRNGFLIARDAADEALLPPITEGALFPPLEQDRRRTLESSEELREMLEAQVSESPELGPPPVAHFEEEGDPIKSDAGAVVCEGEEEEVPNELSVNLETRRRRKDGVVGREKMGVRKVAVFQSPPTDDSGDGAKSEGVMGQTLRTGAKRKLSAREEDEKTLPAKEVVAEDFRFSRKPNGTGADVQKIEEAVKTLTLSPRKVLGERPINLDSTTSPRKPSKPSSFDADSKDPIKKPPLPSKDPHRPRPHARKSKPATTTLTIPPPTADSPPLLETIELAPEPLTADLPPKTPAGLDLFSPASTAPSTARPDAKDTPPPGDLSQPCGTDGGQPARPGRRARAAVNYAEPSLVAKMRRPGKELVDAIPVVRDEKRGASLDLTREGSVGGSAVPTPSVPVSGAGEERKMRTVVIKRERVEGDDEAWRGLAERVQQEPRSPLGGKGGKMVKEAEVKDEEEVMLGKASVSAAAMSALLSDAAGRKRNPPKETSESMPRENVESGRPSLGVYEVPGSSPPDAAAKAMRDDVEEIVKARAARRHSSMSSMNPSSTTGTNPAPRVTGGESARTKAIRELKHRSNPSLSAIAPTEAAVGRSERAAARRRSMML